MADSIAIPRPAGPDADQMLESELVAALAGLENLRARVDESGHRGSLLPLLEMGERMLSELDRFARSRLDQRLPPHRLDRPAEFADRFHASATAIRAATKPSGVLGWLGWSPPKTNNVSRRACQEAMVELIDALREYCEAFHDAFHSGTAARRWADVYGVFLVELERLLGSFGR